MNIFKNELKLNLKSTILWSLSMFIFIFMMMIDFNSTKNGDLSSIIDAMPKALQVMIGGGNFDLSSPAGFFAAAFLYIALLGAVHGCMLGAGILSKEERNKTAEFLLVKPVTRSKILISKLLAALIMATIVSLMVLIYSQLIVASYSDPFKFYFNDISKLVLGYYIIEIIFLCIGLFISTIVKRNRIVYPITSLILFLMFFFKLFSDMFTQVDFLKYLSPFSWFDSKYLLGVSEYLSSFTLISILTVIISIALSLLIYNRKEIEN